ncbi:hypothetical protein ACWDBP_00160 [Streptomyces sp. NPDC001233]
MLVFADGVAGWPARFRTGVEIYLRGFVLQTHAEADRTLPLEAVALEGIAPTDPGSQPA